MWRRIAFQVKKVTPKSLNIFTWGGEMTMDEARNGNDIAVNQMLNYIKSHLQQAITAGDIARAAGYSQYHAANVLV
jgi:AraC-like DNA-binding protein